MTIMDKLQARLDELNMSDFFVETKKELGSYGVALIPPHKENANTFRCIVGILGDDSGNGDYSIDVIREKSFIKIGTTEIAIHSGRGVSMTFYANPSALFSYITYSVLASNDVGFLESEIRCELDMFVELVRDIRRIRAEIDRALRIRLKTYKKTYISKCRNLISVSDEEVKDMANGKWGSTQVDAWRSSLRLFLDFMEKLS